MTVKIENSSEERASVDAIIRIGPDQVAAFVPPLTDYNDPSDGWSEAEYRCFTTSGSEITVGYWTGEPGEVSFDAWPYTEVCVILSGHVGVRDRAGKMIEFKAGEGFVVPRAWPGTWITLEPSVKMFVAIT